MGIVHFKRYIEFILRVKTKLDFIFIFFDEKSS